MGRERVTTLGSREIISWHDRFHQNIFFTEGIGQQLDQECDYYWNFGSCPISSQTQRRTGIPRPDIYEVNGQTPNKNCTSVCIELPQEVLGILSYFKTNWFTGKYKLKTKLICSREFIWNQGKSYMERLLSLYSVLMEVFTLCVKGTLSPYSMIVISMGLQSDSAFYFCIEMDGP